VLKGGGAEGGGGSGERGAESVEQGGGSVEWGGGRGSDGTAADAALESPATKGRADYSTTRGGGGTGGEAMRRVQGKKYIK